MMKRQIENDTDDAHSVVNLPTELWVQTLANLLGLCDHDRYHFRDEENLHAMESIRLVSRFLRDTIDSLVMSLISFIPDDILDRIDTRSLSRFTGLRRVVITTNTPDCVLVCVHTLPRLSALDMYENRILDYRMATLTRLTELNLYNISIAIGDTALAALTNLVTLVLQSNRLVTDQTLSVLTNLTRLDLTCNRVITDVGVSGLTSLTSLSLFEQRGVTDEGLRCLTRLTSLSLVDNRRITNHGLSGLTNLVSLDLEQNKRVTDHGLIQLTNLVELDARYMLGISDVSLARLVALESLNIASNDAITDSALKRLTRLKHLDVSYTTGIGFLPLPCMPQLKTLNISHSELSVPVNFSMANLRELRLAGWSKESIALMGLERMPELRTIEVDARKLLSARVRRAIRNRGGVVVVASD